MSQEQFEDKLYNKLKDFPSEYNAEEVWFGLEEKLDLLDDKSTIRKKWMIALGILIFVLISLLLCKMSVLGIKQNNQTDESPFVENISKENKVIDEDKKTTDFSSTDVNSNTEVKENGQAVSKIGSTKKVSVFNKSTGSSNASNLALPTTFKQNSFKVDTYSKENTDKQVFTITDTSSAISAPEESTRLSLAIDKIGSLNTNFLDYNRSEVPNTGIINNEYDNQFPKSNSFFNLGFSTGIIESSLSSQLNNDPYLAARRNTETVLERIGVTINYEKHLTDRIYVGTGINISRSAKRFRNLQSDSTGVILENQITEIYVSATGDSTITRGNLLATQVSSTDQTAYNNHYNLQIPLFVGYRMPMSERLSVAIDGSVLYAIKTINKGQILTEDGFQNNELSSIENDFYKTSGNINAYFGLNVSYAVYENQLLYFGLNNTWDINGIQSKNSNITEKLSSLNLNFGWKFAF